MDLSQFRFGLLRAVHTKKEAVRLVNSYAGNRPVAEVLPLATAILAARWLCTDEPQADG